MLWRCFAINASRMCGPTSATRISHSDRHLISQDPLTVLPLPPATAMTAIGSVSSAQSECGWELGQAVARTVR